MNKLAIRLLFYGLIVATAFAAALLYYRSAAPAPMPQISDSSGQIANQPSSDNNAPTAPETVRPSFDPAQDGPKTDNQKPSCVIAVDGKKYDVQELRSTHPGGDIFKCDTDMSQIFHGQHGDSLDMIQPYLVK